MVIPSLLFIILLIKIPESTRWLLTVQSKKEQNKLQTISSSAINETLKLSLQSKSLRLPLLIGILLAVFQQFSGINAIIYYGPSIFESAGMGKDDALIFQSIIGIINLVFTFIAIKTADKLGRKPLLLIGLSGMIISLFCCGFLFYNASSHTMLLLFFIVLFIACFAMSVGPVTWILINEIFPNEVRAKAVAACTFALWAAVWIFFQFFPWMLKNAGAAFTFWLFAFFCLLNLLFTWRILKETKNKTLEELGEIFTPGH